MKLYTPPQHVQPSRKAHRLVPCHHTCFSLIESASQMLRPR